MSRREPLRILLAEDNRINSLVLEQYLVRRGHRVDVVENGLEAVDGVARRDFDVVLMDIRMPVMDGLTATRLIRQGDGFRKRIPIIAVTAEGRECERAVSEAGGDACLGKPVDLGRLERTIEEAVSRKGGRRRVPREEHDQGRYRGMERRSGTA